MPLLSKSEVLYLEGHKQLSKSYERKLKCTIRRKIEGLRKDILLLTKLIPIEQIFDFDSLPSQQENRFLENVSNQNKKHGITKFRNINEDDSDATEFSSLEYCKNIISKQSACCNNYHMINRNSANHQNTSSSPAQIRTGVKGSKGLYAWPLHSALIKCYRASGHFYIVFTDVINFTNLFLTRDRNIGDQFFNRILHFLYYLICIIPNIFTALLI
jgi:hypothetical protein